MRNVFIIVSIAAMFAAMTACTSTDKQNKAMMDEPFRQDREFMDKAIRDRSPDVQKVDIIGNSAIILHSLCLKTAPNPQTGFFPWSAGFGLLQVPFRNRRI